LGGRLARRAVVAGLAAWALAALAVPAGPAPAGQGGAAWRLVVAGPRGAERLELAGVRRIGLEFYHSYDRQWVAEWFVPRRGRLVPVEVVYRADTYDHRHLRYAGRVEVGPRATRLTAIRPRASDRLAELRLRVAHGPAQRLVLAGGSGLRRLPLTRWAAPGQGLRFSLEPGSR
jgi:hypothetical protein